MKPGDRPRAQYVSEAMFTASEHGERTNGSLFPAEAEKRRMLRVARGVLDYFPRALIAVAEVSQRGNDQHNPGQPLSWVRDKSPEHEDCLIRHFMERGTRDADGMRHTAKMAWRALAMLQLEIEASPNES